jgi:hypothetical protein
MTCTKRNLLKTFALLSGLLALGGCVERIMKIDSDPPGARVFVNDREVGLTPVKFSFLWYGDYDIILRRDGFQTHKTNYRVDAPWYQYPPIDLVAECLIPTTIRDEHILPTYALEPVSAAAIPDVIERAIQTRQQALSEEP